MEYLTKKAYRGPFLPTITPMFQWLIVLHNANLSY